MVEQNLDRNRPKQGNDGYSPNAHYSSESRHVPTSLKVNQNDVTPHVDPKKSSFNFQTLHSANVNTDTDIFATFILRDELIQDTLQFILQSSMSLFSTTMQVDYQVWTAQFTTVWPILIGYKIFNTLDKSNQDMIKTLRTWEPIIGKIFVPPIANKILSLFGDFATPVGYVRNLTGCQAAVSAMQHSDFVHVLDNPFMFRQTHDVLSTTKANIPSVMIHNGIEFVTPERNTLIANQQLLANYPPIAQATMLAAHQHVNLATLAALGLQAMHVNNQAVDNFQGILTTRSGQLAAYARIVTQNANPHFERLRVSDHGQGCQLVQNTDNGAQSNCPFVVRKEDVMIGRSFNFASHVFHNCTFQGRIANTQESQRIDLLNQAHHAI